MLKVTAATRQVGFTRSTSLSKEIKYAKSRKGHLFQNHNNKGPSMTEQSIAFNGEVVEVDEFGFKRTEQLIRAYSDPENNRRLIEANWPNSSLNPSTPLRRFTTLGRLTSMLQTRTNYLASVLKWRDVYEGLSRNIELSDQNGARIDWSSIRTSFYGQCWTMTEFESELLWHARCNEESQDGVCIRTTFGKLVKSFVSHIGLQALESNSVARCGKVNYVNEDQIMSLAKDLETAISHSAGMLLTDPVLLDFLMVKRQSFQDENEVRLIVDRHMLEGPPSSYVHVGTISMDVSGLSYQVDPTDFIDEIVIDPRVSAETASKTIADVEKLVAKYGWMSKGKPVPVRQSDLYDLEETRLVVIDVPEVNGTARKEIHE